MGSCIFILHWALISCGRLRLQPYKPPPVFKLAWHTATPASGIGQWLLLPSSEKAHLWEVYLAAPSLESPQQRSLLWSSRLHCHLSPDSKAFLQSLHLCPVLCCRFTWVQLVLVPVEVLPRDGTLPGLVIYLWDLTHFLAHRYISVHFCWVNTFLSNTMKVAYLTSTS